MNHRRTIPSADRKDPLPMKRKLLRLAALLLCAALMTAASLPLTACSRGLGDTLITLDGQTMTVNMYRLLLSRAKGNLARSGFQVSSDSFWGTVISKEGTTYDEYFRQLALRDLKDYLAAAVLFDELGLKLSSAAEKEIDDQISSLIKERAGGSKSSLNGILAEYGANIDVLRAMYVMEAKFAAVRSELYGNDGSKIADSVKQEYLEENAVAFRQLLIRSYTYEYEKDLNGDEIYFLINENNGKVSNVAYDTVHGNTRTDEFGKTIVDKNGDKVYYTSDGRISYDKSAGVRAYVYDKDGNPVTKALSKEELASQREAAKEILTAAATLGQAGFEALLAEYEDYDENFIVTEGLCFLYATGDNGYDYLNDIADAVNALKPGEATMLDTEYGCHIVMRVSLPSDAATNKTYEEWFTDLVARVADMLFDAKIAPYHERITVDNDVFASVKSMKEIGTNFYY